LLSCRLVLPTGMVTANEIDKGTPNMKKLLLTLLGLLLLATQSQASELGEKFTLNSKYLKEQREIVVSLPPIYQDEKFYEFPVLDLIDASTQFNHIASTVHYLSGTISPMIVVGIFNPNRIVDLPPYKMNKEASASSENYRRFIAEEVKTFINEKYRTANFSILSGHSLGGAFVLNAYLRSKEQGKEEFDAFLALAPTMAFGNEVMFDTLAHQFKETIQPKLYMYFEGKSTFPTPQKSYERFHEMISKHSHLSDNFHVNLLPEEDHMSASHLGTYRALKHLFADNFLTVQPVIADVSGFDRHYERLSKRLGYQVKSTEYDLWALTSALINSNNLTAAEYVANKSLDIYPESHFSYSLMADVAKAKGEKDKGVKYLKQAIAMSNDDKERQSRYQKRLAEL